MALENESQSRLNLGIAIVLGWLPDALIAVGAMKLTDDEWSTFWWVWFAIQGLYLLNWAKKTAWSWLVWRLWLRRRASAEALTVLTSCSFPKPDSGEDDIQYFFTRLIDDDHQPIAVRVRAAEWRTAINVASSQSLQRSLQVGQAWQDALATFART